MKPVGTKVHRPAEPIGTLRGNTLATLARPRSSRATPPGPPGDGRGRITAKLLSCQTPGPTSGTGPSVGSPHGAWKMTKMQANNILAARKTPDIDQADRDWLESQEFPTRPQFWNGLTLRDSLPKVEPNSDECTADWLASQDFPTRGIRYKPTPPNETQMEATSKLPNKRARCAWSLVAGVFFQPDRMRTSFGI